MWIKKWLKRKWNKSLRMKVVGFIHFTLRFSLLLPAHVHNPPTKIQIFLLQNGGANCKGWNIWRLKKIVHFVVNTKSKHHCRIKWHSSATLDPCTASLNTVSAHSNAEHRKLQSPGMPVLSKGSFHTLWCSLWVSLGIGRCVSYCSLSTYK